MKRQRARAVINTSKINGNKKYISTKMKSYEIILRHGLLTD